MVKSSLPRYFERIGGSGLKRSKAVRQIGKYILFGAITVFTLAIVLSLGDIGEIIDTVLGADAKYVSLAILSLVVYLVLYPLSLCILTRANKLSIAPTKTYGIAMTEHFFNGITPFATGGQPFQAYAFSRAGVSLADSTSILIMNFLVFMLVTNSFSLASLIYFNRFIKDGTVATIAVVGFSINFLVLAFTFAIAASRRVRDLLERIVKMLSVWRPTEKFIAPKRESISLYFENVQNAFHSLIGNKPAFILSLFTKMISMAAYYATTFFILRALFVDVPLSELFFIISGTSFAITMVVFIPTPGSSGGVEFAFKSVFANIITSYAVSDASTVSAGGMLLWRLLTYYLTMAVSLVFYIILEIKFKHEDNKM